ncbi:MAG: ABC transporter substrate-binding protein [Christensenellales bacterium]|jgi:peptide/nickel transport system substrate-binding protein|nr:ABC transporter substrate-binding protein [Clostridiales bacterium]
MRHWYRTLLGLMLALALVMGLGAGAAEVVQLPREETLYFGGQQWGTVATWNPVGTNQNNAMATTSNGWGARTVMFETLYMYNFLDGAMLPLLADGDPVVSEDLITTTVKIKPVAKWSDDTQVTAHDFEATWNIGIEINNGTATNYGGYIDKVVAEDDLTVVITAKVDADGQPVNPLKVKDYLIGAFVAQKAWLETLKERNNNDATAILNDAAEDVPFTGPYGKFFSDDQKVLFVRNDNYWGQDESMWGKLPVPKYIGHNIFADNSAMEVAFKAGEIDVNQQFLPNIQKLWEDEGLPISTYMQDAPYGICLTMPTAWYNMNNPLLKEHTALRKAIAMAVDYDAIIENAMTNQSPSFKDVPRSLMNPTVGEQAMYDKDAVKDLQWAGVDYDGANKLLDEAGIVDSDGDGWRDIDGVKLSFNAVCPNGWTDWMAAMEMVAAAGEKIKIEITTLFPEWSTYQTIFTNPNQKDYDIFMWSPESAAPSMPWGRVRQYLGADLVGAENNWTGNWGQYLNEEADAIIKQIPMTTDEAKLKEMYTELVRIYLTEVPSFALMYRPATFHAVNESVWTNFPEDGDGLNIPPAVCTDGYGIAALYNLKLVGE